MGERRGGKERKGGRTLCLVLVSLGAEVVALLLELGEGRGPRDLDPPSLKLRVGL